MTTWFSQFVAICHVFVRPAFLNNAGNCSEAGTIFVSSFFQVCRTVGVLTNTFVLRIAFQVFFAKYKQKNTLCGDHIRPSVCPWP
jgi:hypothetical protein